MIAKAVALLQVPNQRLFSVQAAARYLGVSVDTLRKYADLGWIEARYLERRRVFALEDLDAFIEALPEYNEQTTLRPGGKPGGKETNNGN